MSVRAFACCAPGTGEVLGYVALSRVEEWPAQTTIVRVRIKSDWVCARLDRARPVEVEGQLLRDAVPSNEQDCPQCAATAPAPTPTAVHAATPEPERHATTATVQAAAISVQGQRMVVVLVRRDIVDNPGEAALLRNALQPRFGNVAIVLMGQDEDGTPQYEGDATLLGLLQGLPVDRMPWKAYAAP